MIRNFFLMALRQMRKQKMHTLFNVLGLAMGIGVCITVYLFVYQMSHMDNFHPNDDRIFMVGHVKSLLEKKEKWGLTPGPLGPALKQEYPYIKRAVRIDDNNVTIRSGDNVYSELVWFVDPDFFQMFNFPLIEGDQGALKDMTSIFLTEEMAYKYFRSENPLGKTLTVYLTESAKREFIVRGVAKKLPTNASFGFNFVIAYAHVKALTPAADEWSYNVAATFVELNSNSDAPAFVESLEKTKLIDVHNAANKDRPVSAFYTDNLLDISKNSYLVRNDISGGTNPHGLIALSVIAILLLLMASFNFMNNIISNASGRLKEIGVRKVVGGSKAQLMIQFVSENVAVSLTALALAVVLAELAFIPFLNSMINGSSKLVLDLTRDWLLVTFMTGLALGVGVISSLYPAIYLSRFETVRIFRNLQGVSSHRGFTRFMLALQFGITMFAVVAAILFRQNNNYLVNLDYGFTKEEVVVFNFSDNKKMVLFKDAVSNNPFIEQSAISQHQAGRRWASGVAMSYQGQGLTSNELVFGKGYFELLKFSLLEGNTFDDKIESQKDEAILINQLFAEQIGVPNPIGTTLRVRDYDYKIIGVVKNFQMRSFMRPMEPSVIRITSEDECTLFSARLKSGSRDDARPLFEDAWKKIVPDQPFQMRFQGDVFENDIRENANIANLFLYIAMMTIAIAAMGLFALVSLNIARRTKEIGVRKILGASIPNIIQLVNRELYAVIIFAAVVFFPISFFALRGLLSGVYQGGHAEITIFPFLGALVVMLLLAAATIGSKVYRVAIENPVKSLRYE